MDGHVTRSKMVGNLWPRETTVVFGYQVTVKQISSHLTIIFFINVKIIGEIVKTVATCIIQKMFSKPY